MLPPGQAQHVVRTPSEHHAVHLDVVVDQRLERFVRAVRRIVHNAREGALGSLLLPRPGPRSQSPGRGLGGSFRGGDRREGLFLAATRRLDPSGVAIQHFQDRESSLAFRELLRHLVRGDEGHHHVVALVVLAAERAGVGESARRDQVCGRRSAGERADECGLQGIDRTAHHGVDEGREPTEVESRGVNGKEPRRRETQLRREGRADPRDQHPASDISEELTTAAAG